MEGILSTKKCEGATDVSLPDMVLWMLTFKNHHTHTFISGASRSRGDDNEVSIAGQDSVCASVTKLVDITRVQKKKHKN